MIHSHIPFPPNDTTGWAVLVVIVAPVTAAILATLFDSPGLYSAGGWYAVFGNFCASWASILLLVIAVLLLAFIFLGLPLTALVIAQVDWACRLVTHMEKWLIPREDMHETDGYTTGENEQTMWDDVFREHLSHRTSLTETACTIAQLGALPIASILILIVLRILW